MGCLLAGPSARSAAEESRILELTDSLRLLETERDEAVSTGMLHRIPEHLCDVSHSDGRSIDVRYQMVRWPRESTSFNTNPHPKLTHSTVPASDCCL